MVGLVDPDDGWRMPDWLWERIEPLLPAPPAHPLGTHRRGLPKRQGMDAILLVLRTGMQWNALGATGVCNSYHIYDLPTEPKRGEADGPHRRRGRPDRACPRRRQP